QSFFVHKAWFGRVEPARIAKAQFRNTRFVAFDRLAESVCERLFEGKSRRQSICVEHFASRATREQDVFTLPRHREHRRGDVYRLLMQKIDSAEPVELPIGSIGRIVRERQSCRIDATFATRELCVRCSDRARWREALLCKLLNLL